MSTLEKVEKVKKYLQEKRVAITGKIGDSPVFFYIANANELTEKEKKKIGNQENVLAIIKGHNDSKNDTLLTVVGISALSDEEREKPLLNREGVMAVIKGKSGAFNVFLAIIDSDYITPEEKAKLGKNANGLIAIIKGKAQGVSILLAVVNTESVPKKVTGLLGTTIYEKIEGTELCIRGKFFLWAQTFLDIISKDYLLEEKNVIDAIEVNESAAAYESIWDNQKRWENDSTYDPVYYADPGTAQWYPGYVGPFLNESYIHEPPKFQSNIDDD